MLKSNLIPVTSKDNIFIIKNIKIFLLDYSLHVYCKLKNIGYMMTEQFLWTDFSFLVT